MRLFRCTSIFFAFICHQAFADDPVFTFSPASLYRRTVTPTATPIGGNLLILPTDLSRGIPAQGIDFFLGPDLRNNIIEAVGKPPCAEGLSADCTLNLVSALNSHHAGIIQARVVGFDDLLFGAVLIGLAAICLAITIDNDLKNILAIPSAVHLESTDIAQLQSYSTAFVYATKSAATPVTITSIPATYDIPVLASATRLSGDQNGRHSGDVVISLPTQPAQIVMQLIQQAGGYGKCQNTTVAQQKAFTLGGYGAANRPAIQDTLLLILPLSAPGQLLNAFGLGAQRLLPLFRDASDQAAVEAAQILANGMREFQGVSQDVIYNIVQVLYLAVYDVCAKAVSDLREIVVEEWFLEDQPNDDDDGCTTDLGKMPVCSDASCVPVKGRCTAGYQRSCPCLNSVTPTTYPANETFLDLAQDLIDQMFNGLSPGVPHCLSPDEIKFSHNDYKKLVSTFCKGADLSKDYSKALIAADAGITGYPPYTFSFDWQHLDGQTCSRSCENIFDDFVASVPCTPDDSVMVTEALELTACGTASISITSGSQTQAGGVSVYVDQGNLDCGTYNDMGNAQHYVSLEMMNNASNYFCDRLIGNGVKLVPNQVTDAQRLYEMHYNDHFGDPVYLSTEWINDPGCPVTDFSSPGAKDMCMARLGTIINGCDTRNEHEYRWWKQGGHFFRDCISWSVRRDDWGFAEQLGTPDSSPDWRPKTRVCKDFSQCTSSVMPQSCLHQSGAFAGIVGPCAELPDSDLRWCKCGPPELDLM